MNAFVKSNIDTKFIASIATFAALISFATAATFSKVEPTISAQNDVVSVSIVGKRMTPEQKLSFDLEQLEGTNSMHQVVISAKRLTAEEKLQMDQQDRALQTSLNTKVARHSING